MSRAGLVNEHCPNQKALNSNHHRGHRKRTAILIGTRPSILAANCSNDRTTLHLQLTNPLPATTPLATD